MAVIAVCGWFPPGATAAEPIVVTGGGQALVSDVFGGEYAASFAVSGVLNPQGEARGSVNFVFGADFGAVWGVFPDETDSMHVYGDITAITVLGDGTVLLEGEVAEADLSHGDGVIFFIEGEPFAMLFDPANPDQFPFTWCLLPVFGAEVTAGGIGIR
jgi:hypothetical protein